MEHRYLIHYSSPYYDPKKAHEYYEEHKQLKGRRSTSGLNEEGRQAASYVRNSINAEKKSKIETHKRSTDSSIENARNVKDKTIETLQKNRDSIMEQHRTKMQSSIDSLQEKLSKMTPDQKAINKDSISKQIAELREENAVKRQELMLGYKNDSDKQRTKYSDTSKKLRTEHSEYSKKVSEEADSKYESELSKIKNEESFKGKTSSKNSKSVEAQIQAAREEYEKSKKK